MHSIGKRAHYSIFCGRKARRRDVGTISDDKSGLVIQFRRGGDWKTDKSTLTAEALFGSKLLQPTKIVRIVSAATTAASETDATSPTGE